MHDYLFRQGASTGENGNTAKEIVVFPLFSFFPFLLPIGVGLYLISLRLSRGSDPKGDSTTVQYDPPERLTPAECGALLENDLDMCGITATLVDLSLRGYFSIGQKYVQAGNASSDKPDYFFHLLKQPDDWEGLKGHERAVLSGVFLPANPLRMLSEAVTQLKGSGKNPRLEALFSSMEEKVEENPALRALSEAGKDPEADVSMSELRGNFFVHVPFIRAAVFDALHNGGYYVRRPDQTRTLYVLIGFLVTVATVVVGAMLAATGAEWLPVVLSGILTALIICVFGRIMPARTIAGARALGEIRGFQNFLGRVEKDRIERLEKSPQLFERYLPYAMALRVDSKWSQAFAGITVQPQEGYKPKLNEAVFHEQLVSQLMAIPIKKAAQ
jgi:predicted membrane protein DUF2207